MLDIMEDYFKPVDSLMCRITTDYISPERFEYLLRKSKSLVVKEIGDGGKVHYHLFVTGVMKPTFDTRLKKYYNGNGQYSNKKVVNYELQLRYLCKGLVNSKPDVIVNTLDVDVDSEYQRFWSDRKSYEESVVKRKKSSKSFIDSVFDDVVNSDLKQVSREYIMTVILDVCRREGKLVPGDYLCISYIETVLNRLGNRMDDKITRVLRKMDVSKLCPGCI